LGFQGFLGKIRDIGLCESIQTAVAFFAVTSLPKALRRYVLRFASRRHQRETAIAALGKSLAIFRFAKRAKHRAGESTTKNGKRDPTGKNAGATQGFAPKLSRR
jgi:hypothetical protein